jgi:hypothetical protein
LIGQRFFLGPTRDLFSQLKKKDKKICTSKLKFGQISKSPEEIPRTQDSKKVQNQKGILKSQL